MNLNTTLRKEREATRGFKFNYVQQFSLVQFNCLYSLKLWNGQDGQDDSIFSVKKVVHYLFALHKSIYI